VSWAAHKPAAATNIVATDKTAKRFQILVVIIKFSQQVEYYGDPTLKLDAQSRDGATWWPDPAGGED